MKLIFGGAYQGKLEYAMNAMKSEEENKGAAGVYTCPSIFDCATPEECMEAIDISRGIDQNTGIINHLEHFTYACVDAGRDATQYLKDHPEIWQDRIVIIEDISQGVVPVDTKERAWREMNGRSMAFLSKEANQVVRMFCGIPQRIK